MTDTGSTPNTTQPWVTHLHEGHCDGRLDGDVVRHTARLQGTAHQVLSLDTLAKGPGGGREEGAAAEQRT